MKKPRPFSLKPIYIDEHRERLDQVERRVAGTASTQEGMARLSFSASREKGGGMPTVSIPMLLSVIIILLASLLLIIFT
ncbi:MAG: hypothetical protein J5552_03020 [Prevotella sp.]|nr:hypothetical protein [Prevotella sp.]